MTKTFKTPAEAYSADYLYAVLRNTSGRVQTDGEIIGYYKTKASADRAARGMEYAVIKTENLE